MKIIKESILFILLLNNTDNQSIDSHSYNITSTMRQVASSAKESLDQIYLIKYVYKIVSSWKVIRDNREVLLVYYPHGQSNVQFFERIGVLDQRVCTQVRLGEK